MSVGEMSELIAVADAVGVRHLLAVDADQSAGDGALPVDPGLGAELCRKYLCSA